MPEKNTRTISDRTRFNWGFWDGRNEAERGVIRKVEANTGGMGLPADDEVYCAAYYAGVASLGTDPETAEPAWALFQASRKG